MVDGVGVRTRRDDWKRHEKWVFQSKIFKDVLLGNTKKA